MSTGYIAVPIMPVFKGMSAKFAKNLVKPAEDAGKRAADSIESGMGDAVKNLERQVAASGRNLTKFQRASEAANAKQEQQKQNLKAVTLELRAAEEKYQKAVASGKSGATELARVERAKGRVLKATNDLKVAEGDAAAAAKKFADQQTDLDTTTGKLSSAQDKLADHLGVTRDELKDMGDEAYRVDEAMDSTSSKAGTWGTRFSGMLTPLTKLGGLAVGLAGINSLAGTLQAGFDKVTSIEDTTASLEILMGSAEKATSVMDQLQESNQGTPYSFDAWAGAGKNLIAFGVDAEKVAGIVTSLGEAASASGKGEEALNSMADAFGQAAASGKISMETINSLAVGGVQGLAILANEYGVTTEEMEKMISGGLVPAKEGIDILTKGIKDGSKGMAGDVASMSGVMGEMAETTSGRITNMKAAFNNAAKAGLEYLNPMIGDLAEKLTDFTYLGIEVFKEKMVPAIKEMGDNLRGVWESARPLVDGLRPLGEWLVDTLSATVRWLSENRDLVVALGVAVASAVVGFKAWAATQNLIASAKHLQQMMQAVSITELWDKKQKALNATMRANMVGIIIAAIAALVAGLTWFFTKTETGQKLWEAFMEKLKAAGEWLQTTFAPMFSALGDFFIGMFEALKTGWGGFVAGVSALWDGVLRPVFQAIWDVAKITIGVIGTVILAPLMLAWHALSAAFQWGWENVIRPVWDAMVIAAVWLRDSLIGPVFGVLRSAWVAVGDGFRWVYDNIVRPVFQAFIDFASWLRDSVIDPVFGALRAAWHGVGTGMRWVYDNVIRPTLDAFVKFNVWVRDSLVKPVFGAIRHAVHMVGQGFRNAWEKVIRPAWNAMGRGVAHVADKMVKPAFHGMQRALDTLKGWFSRTVDAIGRTWERIKNLTKAPIKWVVDVVYNKGIRPAWNAVGKLVGLDELPEHKFARGGILPGYTPGRDPYTFIEPTTGMRIGLSGGEAVIRPEATRVLGEDWVDGVNAAARMGGAQGVKRWLGGFADGGVIGSITNIVREKFPMMTITSTFRPGDPGHHGAGRAVDFSNGFDSTPEMRAAAGYFASNYGKELLELIHSPFNANIKNGQSVGDGFGFYGAGTMDAHRNHVHVAAGAPLAGGGKGGVLGFLGGAIDFVGDQVKKIWDKIINPIKERIPSPAGIIGKYPKAAFDKLTSKAWEFIMSKVPGRSAEGAYNGPVGAGVEQWRPLVEKVLKAKGYDVALTDTVLRRMNQESGGDPRAINNWDVNAVNGTPSKGLMQVIDPTFQANKDPGYDNIWDPEANIRASMNYASRRYGSLPAAYNRPGGYADGGVIDLMSHLPTRLYDRGGWLMPGERALNLSGKPEPVFTSHQWSVLSRGLLAIGDMVPPLKALTRGMSRQVTAFEKWVGKAVNPRTLEGVSARSFASELTEIIGMVGGEHTSAVMKSLIDGEQRLVDVRSAHSQRVADIRDKESALSKAREALAEIKTSDKDGAESRRKVADAERALNKAREGGDAKKIAEAEKALGSARKAAAEVDVKRKEEVKAAADDVAKAEADLNEARMESARSLDVTLHEINPGISHMLKNASRLASSNGLGGLAVTLGQLAFLAGPSGITVGLAVEAVKVGITVISTIVEAVKALVEKFHKARVAARQAVADSWEAVAKYAQLTRDLHQEVEKSRQAAVRGLVEQRDAEFKLRVAQQDRLVAEAEGALAVAKARLALDAEIRKGAVAAQLKLRGLQEDWDTYQSWQAMEAQGTLKVWSDAAVRAFFEYEASRAQAMRAELQARLEMVNAEAALAAAQRQNARNQQDLLIAQERLIRMSAKVAGVDLVEATGGAQASKLLLELFEAQTEINRNVLGRWGHQMGADGTYANQYRGQLANRDNLQRALDAVLTESGITLSNVDMAGLFRMMESVARRGGDPMDVIRAKLPELVEAEGALRTHEVLKPIFDAQDSLRDQERQIEDFRADMDLHDSTEPLEKAIQGLSYVVKSLEHTAGALRLVLRIYAARCCVLLRRMLRPVASLVWIGISMVSSQALASGFVLRSRCIWMVVRCIRRSRWMSCWRRFPAGVVFLCVR